MITRRAVALHSARLALLVAIVSTIHIAHGRTLERAASAGAIPPALATLREIVPEIDRLGDAIGPYGSFELLDRDGQPAAYALTTSPEADDVVGFSGPTNVLIVLDDERRVRFLRILSSRDTREHVSLVREDARFLPSYVGASVDELLARDEIDAVGGATLTSVAIHDAIVARLGGERRSLRFPDAPSLDVVRPILPGAASFEADASHASRWRVVAADGGSLGDVASSAPYADDIVGYQGPTEALLAIDDSGNVTAFAIGRSYENEPYIDYARDDLSFLSPFRGLSLDEIASVDLDAAGIEGVSGATMSSQAIAQGVIRAAAGHVASELRAKSRARGFEPSTHDIGTALTIAVALAIGLTRFRASRWPRWVLRLVVIAYLGLGAGSLLSMAMFAGWATSGVPWQSASGLVALSIAALIVPSTSGRNIYCSHLCAHGALQQMLRRRNARPLRIPRPWLRGIRFVPAALLAVSMTVAVFGLDLSLIDIEPFDAWVIGVGGVATTTIAVVGLIASRSVPMAYCRFGCPTGALLGWLRIGTRSERWSARDWVALGLWGLALLGLW